MRNRRLYAALILFPTLFLSAALAQTSTNTPAAPQARFSTWTAELNGGTYIVRLDTVRSVSLSAYIVDGGVMVTEVTIATDSDVMGRFYYMEPFSVKTGTSLGDTALDKIKSSAEEVATRTGNADKMLLVMKNYPTTTHAKTVEYRVASKEVINKLFVSARDAWLTSNSRKFSVE